MYRVMLLTLAVLLVPATTASAAECTRAVAQERTFEDPVGDSGNAPDLGIVWVDVDDDCVVSITFALDGNRLLAADSLSVTVDDRVFNARGRREGEHLIVFETTVEALGLRPGRPSKHRVLQPLRQRHRRDATRSSSRSTTARSWACRSPVAPSPATRSPA